MRAVQVETSGLAAYFAAQSCTSGRVAGCLEAYWRLRAMRFNDELSRSAVVHNPDDHARQVEFVLARTST